MRDLLLTADVSVRAAKGGAGLPTFSGVAYTGQPMRPEGWCRPVVIDLAGVKVPSQHRPVLRQHDHQQLCGHTTEVKVTAKGLEVAGVFSGEAHHVAKVVEPASKGFQWQLSVGASPTRTEELEPGEETVVNGRTVTGPLTISRETEIGEVSFVPLGADGDTSATVKAQRGAATMHTFRAALKQLMAEMRAAGGAKARAAKYSDEDVDKMEEKEAKAALKKCMRAADDEEEDEKEKRDEKKSESARKAALLAEAADAMAALREQAAAEQRRQADVVARVRAHGVVECEVEVGGKPTRVNLAAHAVAHGWTADAAELVALRAARPGAGVGTPGGLGYSTSTPQPSEEVLEAAVFQAARHQYELENKDFWEEKTPDGRGTRRRVPQRLEDETRRELSARYTDRVQQAAHTLFRGRISPRQILEAAFRANGHHRLDLSGETGIRSAMMAWDHMEREQSIRAEGASNLSISNVLQNVLNKFSLQGYLYAEQAWREICAVRSVSDFKAVKSINLLGDTMFKALGPTSELANASLGDQAFSNQAAPYGRILTIPWTHIVNDDLGMLTGAPMKIGQGAGLALNDNIWTLVKAMTAGTVNGDDGVTFFRTTSSTTAAAKKAGTAYLANKTTGAGSAVSAAALQAAKALFDNQIDPNGNPLGFDGTLPVLLYGPSNYQSWMALLYAGSLVYGGSTSAAATPNYNAWQGLFKPVMSRYLENANYVNSTTAWFMFYSPSALPAIEVAFLNGVDTPAVLQAGPDYQFDRLGISIRGTMPFGSNVQNFRGAVYNVGA